MKVIKRRYSNFFIGDKIYFAETQEAEDLAKKRDKVIDKMMAIQDKDKFAWKNSGEWADLRYDLMDIDEKLKKTCPYLSPEDSKRFEDGSTISDDQIVRSSVHNG